MVGFKPTMPQHEAGTRIDPPPSEADAIETMPDATAAAEWSRTKTSADVSKL